jgi:energy-coupling factor transporter ATP-binding protein EcfA2
MSTTSTSTKVTKKERFAQLMAIVNASQVENSAELVAFIEHEVELLNKKNSRSGKPTARQVENEQIKATILSVMERVGKPMTITQLLAEIGNSELSNQRVSALVTQLKDDFKVIRTVEKKVAFYSLNTAEDETEVEEDADSIEEMGE